MSNIPKLRFPEFKGEWEEKRLKEICDPPKYGLNSAGIEFDGIHKYLRITDIDEITHTFSPTDITTPSEFNDEYLLNKNDIVFARTGASTGKTYLYDSNDGDLYFAGFLIKFHVKDANARFVFYQTLTHKYSKWVHVMSTRSGQPGINSEEYGSYKIKLPDIHEQQKIADFLSNVDSIITAETKILNALQKKKKALMQKLFTRQLRFKSDYGTDFPAWEEKKLGEIAIFSKGNGYSKSDLVSNGTPIILYGRLYTKYETSISEVDTFVLEKKNSVISKGNEIIVPASGETAEDISRASVVKHAGIILGGDLNIIRVNLSMYIPEFIAICISNGEPKKRMAKLAQGKSVVHLHNSDLQQLIFSIPCKAEQQKIADCLSSIDSLIQNQQKVVTTWQQRKKALLQQMFI